MAKQPVKYFVVDAFTDSAFKGNPAAVCLLEDERDEKWLQAVASEFNLSETCFLTRIPDSESPSQNPRFRLRWFTPVAEVNLCGHATLAAAHTLFTSGLVKTTKIEFFTLSGVLTAQKVPEIEKSNTNYQTGEGQHIFFIELDFPTVPLVEYDLVEASSVSKALKGATVIDIKMTTAGNVRNNLLVELSSGKTVADFQPEFDEIEKCPGMGLIITGIAPPHSGFDFFSRYFCPKYGVREDPVTGSVHCALAPFWSKKLGKCDFVAYQASPRGGTLHLHLDEQNQRVFLRGKAVRVMEGLLFV